jgi:hypothetical protein
MGAMAFLLAAIMLAPPWLLRMGRAQGHTKPPVYVILWLDTEDYISPQSDDSAKRLAEFLTRQGIRATFKVVGEKARTLQRRGRQDVIQALARHEIGYHSNFHSWHPIVEEYEEPLDWNDGVQEFTRRERSGFDDVRRIFGRWPSCYGQPGAAWAPQAFAALKQWGVGVYLDDGEHVGLDGKPFWYGGLLNIFNLAGTSSLRPDPDWTNLNEVKAYFQQLYSRLSSEKSGGIISIYYHPWEFIYRQPWDFSNFADGANPPRPAWKPSPVRRPEVIENAFHYFEDYVKYIKSFPDVEFITATQASVLYQDSARDHEFSAAELTRIAEQVTPEVSFQAHAEYTLAASEVLDLLSEFVAEEIRGHAQGPIVLRDTPAGPSEHPIELQQSIRVPWDQFSTAVLDVKDFVERNSQVPSVVWLGSRAVPPESYLVALARLTQDMQEKRTPPDSVMVAPAHLAASRFISGDPAVWYWPVNPIGFRAPHLSALAKLQAWTLKPASLGCPR